MALREEFEKQGIWLFRYRSYLPIIVLVIGLLVYLRSILNPDYSILNDEFSRDYYLYFCLAVSLLGLAIRVYTVGHTPANTSGRNVKEQVADTLNTTGIYSTVRHPLYLGNFLMWFGITLLTGNLWFIVSICLMYWIYYERIMYAEESYLRNKFGDVYINWSSKKPAFIPSFRNFVKPSVSFSWKKVLKKEKNGFAETFLVFCLFDTVGKYITGSQEYNYILIGATIASAVLYIILKTLKNHTTVLDEEGR